jgi:hypothetical protein
MEGILIMFLGFLIVTGISIVFYISYWFTSDILARQIKIMKK